MATQPQPKYWTYEDLFDLPEDRRYEIIEGSLYETPAPNREHAAIIMRLIISVFAPLIKPLGARLYTAPIDLFLLDAGPVQPDLLLLLLEQLPYETKRGIEGSPALIVEILSPSNPEHDRIVKRGLYARAGVQEYWIVSPEAAIVEILTLEGTAYRTLARVAGDEPLVSRVLPDLNLPTRVVFEG
jgi:Uma2 family endonuclease